MEHTNETLQLTQDLTELLGEAETLLKAFCKHVAPEDHIAELFEIIRNIPARSKELMKDYNDKLAKAESSLSRNRSEAEEEQSKLIGLETQFISLQKDLTALQTQKEEVGGQVVSLGTDLKNLKDDKTKLEGELEALRIGRGQAAEIYDTARNRLAEAESNVRRASEGLKTIEERHAALMQQDDSYTDLVGNLRQEAERERNRADRYSLEKAEVVAELDSARETSDRLQKSFDEGVAELRHHLEGCRSTELQARVSELEKELATEKQKLIDHLSNTSTTSNTVRIEDHEARLRKLELALQNGSNFPLESRVSKVQFGSTTGPSRISSQYTFPSGNASSSGQWGQQARHSGLESMRSNLTSFTTAGEAFPRPRLPLGQVVNDPVAQSNASMLGVTRSVQPEVGRSTGKQSSHTSRRPSHIDDHELEPTYTTSDQHSEVSSRPQSVSRKRKSSTIVSADEVDKEFPKIHRSEVYRGFY